jgi:hypothetical protein
VPAAVTRRLADYGVFVVRSYGSAEPPSITGSGVDAPASHADAEGPRQEGFLGMPIGSVAVLIRD